MKYVYLMIALMFAVTAFAQTAAQPTWGDVILAWIANPTGMTAVIAALEFGMRLWPTAQPWSLLVPIKYALIVVAAIFGFLANSVLQPLIDYKNNTTQPALKK